jgi:gingipain R/gingipain K
MKKLFLLLIAVALAVPAMQAQDFRHTDNAVASTPAKVRGTSENVIPAGMVMVTLEAHDVWGDGSGYQMLLDADANAYGTIIPTSGPLSLYTSVSDEVYAEFEYKIPENADGNLYTQNFVFDGMVSILIPAGVYDWCITNPEAGYAMWITSDYGDIYGRQDNYEFVEGKEYVFTAYMTEWGYDGVMVEVLDGAPVTPATEQCAKPEGGFENGIDFHGVTVTLVNNETAEGTELHYNITLNGELIVEDAIYEDAFALTVDGEYYIDFWATAPGMLDSSHGGLIFTIDPTTGLSEVVAGKNIANVRYFNVAGQEMTQAEGLTIVVTTYTDGTTSAAKVVK